MVKPATAMHTRISTPLISASRKRVFITSTPISFDVSEAKPITASKDWYYRLKRLHMPSIGLQKVG